MTSAGKIIPDNFFDEQLEVEREFLDFARSLKEGGLDKLTVTKVGLQCLPIFYLSIYMFLFNCCALLVKHSAHIQ